MGRVNTARGVSSVDVIKSSPSLFELSAIFIHRDIRAGLVHVSGPLVGNHILFNLRALEMSNVFKKDAVHHLTLTPVSELLETSRVQGWSKLAGFKIFSMTPSLQIICARHSPAACSPLPLALALRNPHMPQQSCVRYTIRR